MAVIANQNNNQENQQVGPDGQPLQTVGTAAPSGQGPSGSPMARSAANSLAQQRQGSGRFTNLQKYLQANQGAGQRIAQQVGQNINKNLTDQQQQAQRYYQQLGQNVNQAQQTATQGSGFQQQLKTMGQDINAAQQAGFDQRANQNQLASLEAFTQNPDFSRFQDIQAGRGIDESLLAVQQQKAYQQAVAAQQAAQQAQQQVGTEGGRFELLRQAYGGGGLRPGYSQGQQRLDQVLLGQGGGLGQIQADVASQNRAAAEQARLAGAQAGEVSRLTAAEQGLMGDINTQSRANEEAYMKMLQSYIDPLNAQRQAEFEGLGAATGTYIPTYDAKTKKYSNPLDPNKWQAGYNDEQLAQLGFTDKNQGVFNVFKDQAFTDAMMIQDPVQRNQAIANVIAAKGREAGTAQDVANAQDVSRYAALAKIANIAPEQQRITQESDLGAAWTNKGQGEGSLKERIDAAQKIWDEDTLKKTMSGHAVYSYPTERDWMGNKKFKPADVHSYARGTVEDLLAKGRLGLNNQSGAGIGGINQTARNRAVAALEKILNEQNYAQTLGGRRESFVDAENQAKIDAAKAKNKVQEKVTAPNPIPITGVDPSLEYRNAHYDPNNPYKNVFWPTQGAVKGSGK